VNFSPGRDILAPGEDQTKTSRRRLFWLLGAALAAVALPVRAQSAQKVARVAFVATTSPLSEISGPVPLNPGPRGLVHGLRELGWVEGRNLILERRTAEGNWDRLPEIVAELVHMHTEVIVVPGGAVARVMKDSRFTVPIVVAGVDDLVRSGLVKSLAHPGGNVTGVLSDVDTDSDAKRLQLLLELLPKKPSRIAFLGTKADWEDDIGKNVQALAEKVGIQLIHVEGATRGFASAFEVIRKQRPDALFVARGSSTYGFRHQIGEFALSSHLPSSCPGTTEFTEAGCLMSHGASVFELFRRAASHVDRILKGERPGDLPIEQPTQFQLVLNLKTAKALGITVPQSVLVRADRVIE
jgi:putative ABC transport system substrate-binding protein